MTIYFFDSSALAKRYTEEPGSAWVRACFANRSANVVFIAEISPVEMASAVARRVREGTLPATYARDFCPICLSQLDDYEIVPFDRTVAEMAMALCFRDGLRAYDAIQMCTAILIQDRLRAGMLPPLTFVSADKDLLQAALLHEFLVVDPNAL